MGDVHDVKQSHSWFQFRPDDHRFTFSNPRKAASVKDTEAAFLFAFCFFAQFFLESTFSKVR